MIVPLPSKRVWPIVVKLNRDKFFEDHFAGLDLHSTDASQTLLVRTCSVDSVDRQHWCWQSVDTQGCFVSLESKGFPPWMEGSTPQWVLGARFPPLLGCCTGLRRAWWVGRFENSKPFQNQMSQCSFIGLHDIENGDDFYLFQKNFLIVGMDFKKINFYKGKMAKISLKITKIEI